MGRYSDERRDRLVHSTLKVGWVKFGAPELDEATYEYISGIACSVMADVRDAEAGEAELMEQLGPLLRGQDLKQKQVSCLCKAIARCVFPARQKREAAGAAEAAGRQKGDAVLCCIDNLILMYMGSSKLLLKETTFELLRGHRYGVVGSNGVGKTTLMERIANGGVDELSRLGLRFIHIRHETLNERVNPATPAWDFGRSVVGEGAPLHHAFDEVGFTDELKHKPIRELSGGWRVRLLLATAVAQQADVLLLDEPTNHLDAEAVAWLVDYLTNGQSAATSLVVSHDAPFLDKVCTDIVHFDECRLKYYAGNFARFREQAALHDEEEVRAVLQVRRSDGEPPTSGQGDPSSAAAPAEDASSRISFPIPGRVEGIASSRKAVIEVKDACYKYPTTKAYALQHVSGRVTMASRIAIIGPNGAGKSTLMALLCGEIRPTPDERGSIGLVNRHRSLRLAYIAQGHSFHLKDYLRCTASEYIQLRYRNGYDEELQKRLGSAANEEEERAIKALAARYGKYGKRVEAVVSRCRKGGEWLYEVQWEGLSEKQNTFESTAKLRQLGVERLAAALDERLAAVQVGNDERPLTRREIVRHFEAFGLSEEVVTLRAISSLSGGQKSKLMIGAAFWSKPHVVCLDEPTNFLDFETVAALSRALRQFRGGVVIVSHNEDFLAPICDEIWSVQDHRVVVVKTDAAPTEAAPDGAQSPAHL